MLHIFPTSRMVREFYNSHKEDTLLPYAVSIGNFESKAILVPDLKLASQEIRILLLQRACDFDNFKKLKIPSEFLAFLSNSSYIFRFFEELAVEQKTCNDLKNADVYAEYDEHLDILDLLQKRYIKLLEQNGYYDSISLPSLYQLNKDYLQRFEKISLHVEGFLNAYEWDLFKQISSFLDVKIYIHINAYNQKMRDLFANENINLPKSGFFEVNLNDKSYEALEENKTKPSISTKSFSQRSLQIGYINEQISNFIDDGLAPEEIAVILPDEKLAPLLKAYDRANNLNFAMGFPFAQTQIFQKLNSIYEFIKEDNPKTRNSLQRHELQDKIISFKDAWANEMDYEKFEKLIDDLDLNLDQKAQKIFQNELYHLQIILLHINLKLSQIFKLFLQRLSQVSIDDVGGGRVVVMGVLETRGVRYKALIIPDFNDEFIPRFVNKDMFLSSKVREYAGLPSLRDRENLQRYFYHSLIQNAQKVAICFVEDENSLASRFLQSLEFKKDERYDEKSYASLLFEPKEKAKLFIQKDLIHKNNILEKPLSSSRLKKFLTCKRGYYLSEIMSIEYEDLPSDSLGAQDIGIFLHSSLQELYEGGESFLDARSLHLRLKDLLFKKFHKDPRWLLERELWQKKLMAFCEHEIDHFKQGWKPFAFEVKLNCFFEGVRLEGRIDRIDKNKNGEFCVLDYKSGKISMPNQKAIEKMIDFQLQFYYLLVQNKYKNVSKAGFYDLNKPSIIWEDLMDEKIEKLSQILQEIKAQKEINFALDEKDCVYSPYDILLGRYHG